MNAAPVYPTQSTPRSGLIHLRNEVARYFEENDVPAVVAHVGLKYRSFTLNQNPAMGANRLVFIPGAFSGGTSVAPRAYGSLSRNTRNATSVINPRELAHWDRVATLSIWAGPVPGMAESEEDSLATAEDLLEKTVRAIESARVGDTSIAASLEWGSVTINSPPNDSAFGAELLVQFTQRGPLFDRVYETTQAKNLGAMR